jgi:hypothetical protein
MTAAIAPKPDFQSHNDALEAVKCTERLQAMVDKLRAEGADRRSILDALMEVAVKVVREDPNDFHLIQLEDAAAFLLDAVSFWTAKRVPSQQDPDAARRARNEALLSGA